MAPQQSESALRLPGRFLGLLPWLAVVAIHGLTGLYLNQPVILADELGYLGNARYLSGVAHIPDLVGCQFYHFGYSLVLVPLFWLLHDPVAIYRAALFINAMMMGGLFAILNHLLVSFLDIPPKRARWIAFASCLYPSLVLYSSFALSETAFILIFVAIIALFGSYLRTGTTRSATCFGLAAGFLYTIHPRALPVVAVVLLCLVLLMVSRARPAPQALMAIAAMGSVVALTRVVNLHLKVVGWGGSGEFSAIKLAGRVLPGADFLALIERALGQVLYLVLASHGIFLVGFVAVLFVIFKKASRGPVCKALAEPGAGVLVLTLLSSAGIFVASCTSKLYSLHGPTGVRGADIIHGRYNEAGAVLMLALALAFLTRQKHRFRTLAAGWLIVSLIILGMSAAVMVEVEDAQQRHRPEVTEGLMFTPLVPAADVDPVNVPAVFPIIGLVGSLNLYWVALGSFSVLLIFSLALCWSRNAAMVVLMMAFATSAVFNQLHYRIKAEKRNAPRLEFAAVAHRLGAIEELSYDVAFFDSGFFYASQYLFPRTVFHRFDSRTDEDPRSEAVISGDGWHQTGRLGARFVVAAEICDNVLWLRPGRLQDRLPVASPEGVVLGSDSKQFVRESGFYSQEQIDGVSGRWTDGHATLRVPLNPRRLPEVLGLETMVPGQNGARLQVVVNGFALMDEKISPRRESRTLDLEGVTLGKELLIELVSESYSPGEDVGNVDDWRKLGVFVVAVRVESHESLAAAILGGLTLAAEPVFGVPESGFYGRALHRGGPARWTDGHATLKVPVDPTYPPRKLRIETVGPRKQPVQLRVVANGVELWNREISLKRWRKTLRLEGVPLGEELQIEILSNTFLPPDVEEGSTDPRILGLMIRSIRLER